MRRFAKNLPCLHSLIFTCFHNLTCSPLRLNGLIAGYRCTSSAQETDADYHLIRLLPRIDLRLEPSGEKLRGKENTASWR